MAHWHRPWLSAGVFAAALPLVTAAADDRPTLEQVLERVARYVAEYQRRLGVVIAEEQYTQKAETPRRRGPDTFGIGGEQVPSAYDVDRASRRLVSEFLMLRLAGDRELWTGVRDVVEVDGKPIPDRVGRLTSILQAGGPDLAKQWRALAEESARFNIGPFQRDFNVPTFALVFVRGPVQPRCVFSGAGEQRIGNITAWRIAFTQASSPTVVLWRGRDMPFRGMFWVDPGDGRVLRTRIEAGDPSTDYELRIDVRYDRHQDLDAWLPVEMTERYETSQGKVTGKATYRNYRRFDVEVKLVG